MSIHAFIDGDWILYAAGFAGQKTRMVVPTIFGAEEFKNITEIRQKLAELDGDEGGEHDAEQDPVYSRIVLDPPAFFYHSAKKMIDAQLQKVGEKFNAKTVNYTVMMDGDGNFRTKIATLRPYKGTRHIHAKPLFYNELRSYLLDAWEAEVIFDHETDDEMAIRQTAYTADGRKSIIVAVDKDMLQVPGLHLNPNKGFKKISQQEGDWRLFVQALEGDTVDNIGGAYKIGKAAARKRIGKHMTTVEMWDAVVDGYQWSMDKHADKYPEGMTAEDAALENMRLVYLRRQPGEIWTPDLL